MNGIRIAVLPICAALTLSAGAEVTPADIWFCADFDHPAVMAGKMISFDPPAGAIQDGKFGKACHFRRPGRNILPPTSEFLAATNSFKVISGVAPVADAQAGTLAFAGGEIEIPPRGAEMPNHWVNKDTSSTFAFEVKGAKGTTVTITPLCPPAGEKYIASLKKNDKNFAIEKCQPDQLKPRTYTLGGDWQRVWNYVAVDIRLRQRPVGWRIAASGPVTLRRFMMEPTGTFPYGGIRQPTEWVDGGVRRWEHPIKVSDPALLKSYPATNGAFACWVRTPPEWCPSSTPFTLFYYGLKWDKCWYIGSNGMATGAPYERQINGWAKGWEKRADRWQHLAATWNADALKMFVNGKLVATFPKPSLRDDKGQGTFILGADAQTAADVMLDEFAIFNRALGEDEVAALFAAKAGLRQGELLFAASRFTAFPRNIDGAALAADVHAPEAADYTLRFSVGGVASPDVAVKLAKGANRVAAPFRASDFAVGEYPWVFRLVARDGKVALEKTGTLRVTPRFERDGFRFLSWGLDINALDFYATCGLNAGIIYDTAPADVAKAAAAGMHVVLRLENVGAWRDTNFDAGKIRADVTKRLTQYAGLPHWDSTLLNSETYAASSAEQAVKYSRWRAWAKEELGHEPSVAFTYSPCGVNWGKVGKKSPRGVLPQDDTFDTLAWVMRRGMPHFFVNRVDREVIHRLSPGNLVWSEPSPSPESLDGTADWIYNYDPFMCLYYLRYYEATPRGAGKKFIPTLAMGYWSPDWQEIQIDHPTQTVEGGKKARVWMSQTCDELMIKTWMAVAGSGADAVSYFSADWSWLQAMTNGVLHEKGLPLQYSPGWQKYCLAEKDCAPRYGKFVRETMEPVARLLRGIPTDRAPVAIALPLEIGYQGEFWWPRVNFPKSVGKALARSPIPYDVISDGEFTKEVLAQYPYVLCPQFCCVTPEHDKVIRSVRETQFLTDNGYRPPSDDFKYPNVNRLLGWKNDYPWTADKVDMPLLGWLKPKIGEFRQRLAAWSEEDGEKAWTFCKTYKGVHYVAVVNNLRRAGGCPQTDIYTNATYRPMGAPQRITTHFNAPGTVYAFNAGTTTQASSHRTACDGGAWLVSSDYAAAEGKLFCVYPNPLDEPKLALEGKPAAGATAELVVKICEKTGRAAPGRQIVRLTLTDPDGSVADESGLYAVEDGAVRIPLRFTRAAKRGGFFAKWKANVTDLTSGLSATLKFALR